ERIRGLASGICVWAVWHVPSSATVGASTRPPRTRRRPFDARVAGVGSRPPQALPSISVWRRGQATTGLSARISGSGRRATAYARASGAQAPDRDDQAAGHAQRNPGDVEHRVAREPEREAAATGRNSYRADG